MGTKVYKYFCEPASREDEQIIARHMRATLDYRHALARAENARRDAVRAIEDESDDVRLARKQVARWYAVQKKMDDRPGWNKIAEKGLKQSLAVIRTALKARRAQDDYKPRVEDVDIVANKAEKLAYATARNVISLDTANEVREAHADSVSTSRLSNYLKVDVETGEGVLAVWTYPHVPIEGDWGNRVSLSHHKVARPPAQHRPDRIRPEKYNLLTMHLITNTRDDVGKKVVDTANFRVLLHRPLPEQGDLVAVRVHRVKDGPRYRYSAQFVVNNPVNVSPADEKGQKKLNKKAKLRKQRRDRVVGVDLGCSNPRPGVIRLAYAVGDDGEEYELTIPTAIAGNGKMKGTRAERTQYMQSHRDTYRNMIRAFLVRCRENYKNEWFQERTTNVHNWKKGARFGTLLRDWRENRFEGDEGIFAVMEAWAKRDRHLWAYIAGNDRRMRNMIEGRREQWCAMIAERYGTVVVEDISGAELKFRARGQVAAPYMVLQDLKYHTEKRKGTYGAVKAAYTSRTCNVCGHVNPKLEAARMVVCEGCGVEYDRDVNAAKNILERGIEAGAGGLGSRSKKASTHRRARKNRRGKGEALENGQLTSDAA